MMVTLIDSMGTDLSVVNAARVSFGKKKDKLDDSDIRLINYLGRHNHISPFGHCFATFHVCAPIFVARQLVKHKFLRWNEISRRYVDDPPKGYYPNSLRSRSADKKQGSGGSIPGLSNDSIRLHFEASVQEYNRLLDSGVCPEQARMILPQNMMTEWYWSGSMDAFADMCNLRCKGDTQYETQTIAYGIDECCSHLWPISWSSLRGLVG